jgi:hypothetical protein
MKWKKNIAEKLHAKGQKLSNKLMGLGYDAIITKYPEGDYGEIVLLANAKFILNKPEDLSEEKEDYRGYHQAPNKDSGAPLHDVTTIYPDDFYTLPFRTVVRYYGSGDESIDAGSISIVLNVHNKPNMPVKIYRAVPNLNSEVDAEIKKKQNLINQITKLRTIWNNPTANLFVPSEVLDAYRKNNPNITYDEVGEKALVDLRQDIEQLQTQRKKLTVNPNDWVTINRRYAVEHGESWLNGNYKILTKTVPAHTLYTIGDSINEWGYDPS